MKFGKLHSDDEPQLDLIPLIDVILCLIIFFVVTTTFDSRAVLRLQLPKADGVAAPDMAKPLTLLVSQDGRYFFEDREVLKRDIDSLKQTIIEAAGSDRNRTVLLRADGRSQHQSVVTAYEALGQLGFTKVMIATAPPTSEKGAKSGVKK